ncbi:hypothetical protein FOXG_20028 [Fusarium oxysporum f. sp. lycopersici 4287]|uniref:Uncharacterized protein n=1 Tax=Fusarium oxysporum f. sp. lycopersici (strain 4287 / CBS 123668 / FGSC 9935 / NRRL 34936) TaxID=426428 RepID=A0A0J9WP53_FUSO4|nr:hypothetical protein FOXG_20028 [Fusarium oxysporum f. sp. lycopersici 4287]KNB08432.1 hypothetical protein FOXG_20028 [Fusarium oxysporum f. sp. lycopersici 4287]
MRNIISRFDHVFRSNYRFLGETTLVSFSFLYGTRPTCLFVHAAKDSTTFFLPLRVSELQNPPPRIGNPRSVSPIKEETAHGHYHYIPDTVQLSSQRFDVSGTDPHCPQAPR